MLSPVLIFYEYVITFRREVKLFWRLKVNGASVLFFMNRYIVLIIYILNMMGFARVSDKVRTIQTPKILVGLC